MSQNSELQYLLRRHAEEYTTAMPISRQSNSGTASFPGLGLLILLCFFCSGLTSLALETAWSKSLSYLLGTDLYGAATTIVAYMAGLGLGALLAAKLNARFKRPMRVYAALQLAIAMAGLSSVFLLAATQPVFDGLYALSSNRSIFLLGRFTVTFAVLLPATTLMGMTLPVVIGAYGATGLGSAASAGLLYGVNTLGAVAGALIAGFGLIPRLGLARTCIAAAALDLALAVVAYTIARRVEQRAQPVAAAEVEPRSMSEGLGVTVPVLLSGMTALALELCWFRLLGQVIGPSVHAFSVTLGVFLTGVGLGSVLGSRILGRFSSGATALFVFLVASVVLAVVPGYYFHRIPEAYKALWALSSSASETSLMLTQGAIGCAVMLPATLASGAIFPAAVRAYRERYAPQEAIATISGRLFFVNTFGSVLGTLLWAFWVVPAVGVFPAIQLAAAGSLLAAAICLGSTPGRLRFGSGRFAPVIPLLAVLVSGIAVAAPARPKGRALHEGAFYSVRSNSGKSSSLARPMHQKARVVFAKDGLNGSVTVIANRYGNGGLDLAFSGKWVASTQLSTRRSLHLLGHLPMLLAKKEPENALVIGLGTGITSGGLLLHPGLKNLDIVEIEPAVVEASKLFAKYNHSPFEDPRTRLIIQDGRTYMAFGSKQYDVITSDPIHPWVKGAANLYTREYYEHVARRLAPGGIFCQWIPSTMSTHSFKSILLTLRSSFPEVGLLFAGPEAMAFGLLEPVQLDSDEVRERMEKNPAIGEDMRGIALDTAQRMIQMLRKDLRTLPSDDQLVSVLNTDDNVFLEHQLPWDMFHAERVRILRTHSKPWGGLK